MIMVNEGNASVVSTSSGRLEGTRENNQFVFRGIPYAAPPVGKLRWHPPQRVTPWDGVRPAHRFGTIAPQNTLPGSEMMAGLAVTEPQSEDCLFLNVWTPGCDDARRPVMVWIHGGAFIIGSGSQEMFRNTTLVDRCDVVLVTVNYRLGALGFMNLHEITGGTIPATGCEGLLDQIAALNWVHENIYGFGGDPDNITVFGESAGAMSIGNLMSMPVAKGTFHKAILESGGANTVCLPEEAVSAAASLCELLNLQPDDTEAWYSLTVDQIMRAQQRLGNIMREKDNRITPFQPVVDGVVLPEIPLYALQQGAASGIPTLAGTNLDEFKLFNAMEPGFRTIDEAAMIRRLEGLIPPGHVPAVVAAYREGRAGRGESPHAADILAAIQSDIMFRVPVLNLVEAQCRYQHAVYNYLFTWKSPVLGGRLGACHTLEIGFVFGNYDHHFCGTGPEADALSRNIQDAWTSFARSGNPGRCGAVAWEPYGEKRTTMILGSECRCEDAPYEEERRVWDTFEMLFTKPI